MLLVQTNALAYGFVARVGCRHRTCVLVKTFHLRGPVLLLCVYVCVYVLYCCVDFVFSLGCAC